MRTKRELKAELVRLTYRVRELEERLCPCEEHDWRKVGEEFQINGITVIDVETIYHYKCKRCGKACNSWRMLDRERRADNATD